MPEARSTAISPKPRLLPPESHDEDSSSATICTMFELASALIDLGLSSREATVVTLDLLESGQVRLIAPQHELTRPC